MPQIRIACSLNDVRDTLETSQPWINLILYAQQKLSNQLTYDRDKVWWELATLSHEFPAVRIRLVTHHTMPGGYIQLTRTPKEYDCGDNRNEPQGN